MRSSTVCPGPGRKLERTRYATSPSRRSRLAGCTWSASKGGAAMPPAACNFSMYRPGKTPGDHDPLSGILLILTRGRFLAELWCDKSRNIGGGRADPKENRGSAHEADGGR